MGHEAAAYYSLAVGALLIVFGAATFGYVIKQLNNIQSHIYVTREEFEQNIKRIDSVFKDDHVHREEYNRAIDKLEGIISVNSNRITKAETYIELLRNHDGSSAR